MLVTQDTEIEALLGRLTDEIRRNSNDSLVGLYVYGSLVTGDFDKYRSDIDLLAVRGVAPANRRAFFTSFTPACAAARGPPGRGDWLDAHCLTVTEE